MSKFKAGRSYFLPHYIKNTRLPALALKVNPKVQNCPRDPALPPFCPSSIAPDLHPSHHVTRQQPFPATSGITQQKLWRVTRPCRQWLLAWDQFALCNPPHRSESSCQGHWGVPHLPDLQNEVKQKTKWHREQGFTLFSVSKHIFNNIFWWFYLLL